MLALLRYRRIAHRVVWGTHFDPPTGYPTPKVKLLPTIYMESPEGMQALVDSTPLIRRLEIEFSERRVVPEDPLLRFLDLLIEDFADEWVTKAMFHYRWHHAPDAAHAAPLLAYSQNLQLSPQQAAQRSQAFAQRQISRLSVVGSNAVTAPVIEASFERLVGILDRIIERHGFVLGARPASADFALYGQLTQLGIIDPTPARILGTASPRLRAWLDQVEDLSGHQSDRWIAPPEIQDQLGELLNEIGRVYAPFLLANAQACAAQQLEFQTTIDGHPWVQPVFPYQAKCLQALQQARLDLPPLVQASLDQLLQGSGCEVLFQSTRNAPP